MSNCRLNDLDIRSVNHEFSRTASPRRWDAGPTAVRFLLLLAILHAHGVLAAEVSFRRDVAPVLLASCYACHNQRTAEGSFRLDSFAQLMQPGDSGERPVVVGRPEDSELVRRLVTESEDERMPLDGDPLADATIAMVRQWIRTGARYDAEDPQATLASILPITRHPDPPAKYQRALPITALTFDGDALLVGGYHEILRWEWRSATIRARIPQVGKRIYGIHVDAASRRLFVGSGTPGQLGEVRVLNADTHELLGVPLITQDTILDIDVAPGGKWLAAAGADARIHLIDLQQLKRVRSLDSHSDWVQAIAWHADGTILASASRDRTAKLFDVPSGRVRATYSGHGAAVMDVDFLVGPNMQLTSCDIDGDVHVWNASDTEKVRDLPSQGDGGIGVVARSDGVWVVTKAGEICQVKGEEIVRKLIGHSHPVSVAIDDASRWLATGDAAGQICVWDTQQEKLVQQFSAFPLEN